MLVIGPSAGRSDSVNFDFFPIFPHECDIFYFTCNNERKIVGLILENEWMSRRGGGIIAKEISTLSHLKFM